MSNDILDSECLFIYGLFSNNSFNVPIYQRPYFWSTKELTTLLNDIYNQYEKSESTKTEVNYYIGNIILHKKDHKTYNLIDV